MSISPSKLKNKSKNSKPKSARSFVAATALAKGVAFDDAMMRVTFTEGRVLGVNDMRSAAAGSVRTGLNWTKTCRSPD